MDSTPVQGLGSRVPTHNEGSGPDRNPRVHPWPGRTRHLLEGTAECPRAPTPGEVPVRDTPDGLPPTRRGTPLPVGWATPEAVRPLRPVPVPGGLVKPAPLNPGRVDDPVRPPPTVGETRGPDSAEGTQRQSRGLRRLAHVTVDPATPGHDTRGTEPHGAGNGDKVLRSIPFTGDSQCHGPQSTGQV